MNPRAKDLIIVRVGTLAVNTVQIRARVEKRPLESLARASLATTSQARWLCQATGNNSREEAVGKPGEGKPRHYRSQAR